MPSSSQQQQQQPPPVSSSTTTALSSTPSLCGSFLQNKRSLIAFTWTVTTFCTWIACFLAIALSIQISSYYNRMEQNYVDEQNQGDPGRLRRYLAEEEDSNDSHDSNDQQHSGDNSNAAADSTATLYYFLAHTSSSSMAFVSAYMTVLALGLTFVWKYSHCGIHVVARRLHCALHWRVAASRAADRRSCETASLEGPSSCLPIYCWSALSSLVNSV
jgi:hypothetical protein